MRPSSRAACAAISLALGLIVPLATSSPATSERRSNGDGDSVAQHSLRSPVTDENFYFVMADRFKNGDIGNERSRAGSTM